MPNSNVSAGSNGPKKRGSVTFQEPLEREPSSNVPQSAPTYSLAETNAVSRGRIAIFIDAASLFYAALQLGITIDYSKLLVSLTGGDRLLRCFFYIEVEPTSEKQQSFLLWMRRNGYRVVAKEPSQHPDGAKKVNVAVEIAVDMLSLVKHYDTAVLISSDGNLVRAVDTVSYQGIRVEVIGLRSVTSERLIRIADHYIDLEQIKKQIQKVS